jgi:hypothetical protein
VTLPTGPYATVALRGPFATREAWCADLASRLRAEDQDAPIGCAAHTPIVTSGPTRLTATTGITVAELVAYDTGDLIWGPKCALVLRVARGWFVAEDLIRCLADPDRGSIVRSVAIDELAWQDVVTRAGEALGPELVLRATMVRSTPSAGEVTATDMFVCGLGPSGVPRCTPAIPVHHIGIVTEVKFHPAIDQAGMLRFAIEDVGDTMPVDDADRAALSRKHPLRYP